MEKYFICMPSFGQAKTDKYYTQFVPAFEKKSFDVYTAFDETHVANGTAPPTPLNTFFIYISNVNTQNQSPLAKPLMSTKLLLRPKQRKQHGTASDQLAANPISQSSHR
jgi:hypothetical protein